MADSTDSSKATPSSTPAASTNVPGADSPGSEFPGADLPGADTPAMRQYMRFKREHPGCVLFFRMGDFYEMFYDDAKLAHKAMGVTLTQRQAGVPMAGVPYHAVESYLRRMIRAGYRVAVCDQVEDPATAKGLVKRAVTRVVTPGTLTDDNLLDESRENPLAAILFHKAERGADRAGNKAGGDDALLASVAWAELSTGAFHVATFAADQLGDELARIGPRELLYVETADAQVPARIKALTEPLRAAATARPAWQFRQATALETLRQQYGVASLTGFGLSEDDPVLGPAAAIVRYLLETQKTRDRGTEGPRGQAEKDERRKTKTESSSKSEVRSGGDEADDLDAAAASSSTHEDRIAHLQPPRRFVRSEFLIIDQVSLRSLEVERTIRSGGTEGSLLGVFMSGGGSVAATTGDKNASATGIASRSMGGTSGGASGSTSGGGGGGGGCVTAMGKRALRQWLCYPLRDRTAIERRQAVVEAMVNDPRFLDEAREALDGVQDVQRILARIAVGRATPRDLVGLGTSSARAAAVERMLSQRPTVADIHRRAADAAGPLGEIAAQVAAACVEAPPPHLRQGGLIRDGYDTSLDEFRGLQRDSHAWLASYQKQLIDQSQIPSLKVGFNKVFGYYIELTAAQRNKMDDKADAFRGWIRKQTLKNCERFITPELKEFEGKVLTAESRAIAREGELFFALCSAAQERMSALQAFAELVAELDVLACFALRAVRRRYVRPKLVDEPVLHIRAGRHPVLDEVLGERFVPNDVELGPRAQGPEPSREEMDEAKNAPPSPAPLLGPGPSALGPSLALITGPNMAGKSTYIRQAALITLLAHTGSFVPAEEATIGLCDRIFTRIGASDELHAGQSTFMVEMTETANICHHATPGSLVILDEIGRGTGTLDGLSLAWAIAEHLAQQAPRTLFATHYHELIALAERFPNVINLNVTVREWGDQIVFLHRIAPGSTNRSYGIHVAKIAGLPPTVVARANELLSQLQVSHTVADAAAIAKTAAADNDSSKARAPSRRAATPADGQLSLFTEYLDHPAVDALRKVDLNRLSPIEAFDILRKLKSQADQTGG